MLLRHCPAITYHYLVPGAYQRYPKSSAKKYFDRLRYQKNITTFIFDHELEGMTNDNKVRRTYT